MHPAVTVTVTTPPADEPLILSDVKDFLRVSDTNSDTMLGLFITAARQHAEMFTRRAFITRTYTGRLTRFPFIDVYNRGFQFEANHPRIDPLRDKVELPFPNLQAVSSVTYFDENNAAQTLSPSCYFVATDELPGAIHLSDPANATWPVTYVRPDAVSIVYTAGYGAQSAVPESLKTAMKYLIKHWFDNPDLAPGSGSVAEMPFACRALLAEHTVESFA